MNIFADVFHSLSEILYLFYVSEMNSLLICHYLRNIYEYLTVQRGPVRRFKTSDVYTLLSEVIYSWTWPA